MTVDWGTVLGTGFGGAMLYSISIIVKTAVGKRLINADAAAKLSNSANDMIKSVRADAERSIEAAYEQVAIARRELEIAKEEARNEISVARREAEEARRQAAKSQREATEARRSSDESLYFVRRLSAAILNPRSTIDDLREMVDGFGTTRIHKPSE